MSSPAPDEDAAPLKLVSAEVAEIQRQLAALESSSDEDDTVTRPGKVTGELMVSAPIRSERVETNGSTQQLSARERVKRLLQAEHSEAAAKKKADDDDDDDDDDIVAPRSRRLHHVRRQRSATPDAATPRARNASASSALSLSPRRADSPGLFVSPHRTRVSGSGTAAAESDDSDDLSPVAVISNRVQALLARKRAEREAREAETERKRAARRPTPAAVAAGDDLSMASGDESSNAPDDEGGRRLTQKGRRPAARKASKKALEAMHRETQRMSRSLQLAHEVKTRKKLTKSALFARFNFKMGGDTAADAGASGAPVEKTAAASSSRPGTPGSAIPTDAEMKEAETPPSSPPAWGKVTERGSQETRPIVLADDDDDDKDFSELDTVLEAAAAAKRRAAKGKDKATAADLEAEDVAYARKLAGLPKTKRSVRVKLPVPHAGLITLGSDEDEDDRVVIRPTPKSKLDAIFARVPAKQAKESRPLQVLRRLAHLDDPDRRAAPPQVGGGRPTAMTTAELHFSLQQRARTQARQERDRRLEMLRAKGVHVRTDEERETEMRQVDDIVAKARAEAEELRQREREAGKEEKRGQGGEVDPLAWDDSEDESYDGSEEGAEHAVVELSGSEEEENDGGGEEEEEEENDGGEEKEEEEEGDETAEERADDDSSPAALLDKADESRDGQEEAMDEAEAEGSDGDAAPTVTASRRRPRKLVTVLSDDEDEAGAAQGTKAAVEATPRPKAAPPTMSPSADVVSSPRVPTSVLRSAAKTFIPGVPVAGPAGLGLTQIFAGTMDDSSPAGSGRVQDSPSQPMPTFDLPDSNFSQTAREASAPAGDLIMDSQPTQGRESQGGRVRLGFSQSQVHGFDSLLRLDGDAATQMSDLLEPTQDAGFRAYSPLKRRFDDDDDDDDGDALESTTTSTVAASQDQASTVHGDMDSPLVRRAGRLVRRKIAVVEEEDETVPATGSTTDAAISAFKVMKEAAARDKKRKAVEAFDKKRSKAREMVEDQAEESEDEYAGLGGADGEDSSDDDAASVKDMIDDETKNGADDDRKLAAFFADRERASDSAQVEKLFRDITTGMLRRKRARGGDLGDLSDSDDGGEARRRLKRRQFAKMQRVLLADERISKVAENPRNQAFLRTIEDVGSDDDMDLIMAPPGRTGDGGGDETPSVPPAAGSAIPDSQPQPQQQQQQLGDRRPAAQRRTQDGKRPAHIGEIRASLSNLLDEPMNNTSASIISATDSGSDDDDDDDDDVDDETARGQANPSNKENQHPRRTSSSTVIDRIALKRMGSSSTTTTTSSSSSRSRLAFAAPSGSGSGFKVPALLRRATTNSFSAAATAASTTSGGGGVVVAKSATKRSGISYLARETERRAAVAENEKRREARKARGAEGRAKVVGGLFGMGKFE